MINIGIAGIGFVGNAIYNFFKDKENTICYDKYKDFNKKEELLETDILFLALPTIYNEELKEYDKSAIYEVSNFLNKNKYNGIVIIKSTVEPGTTSNLSKKYNFIKFVHNPEFLSASTAIEDFLHQKHIVLGKGLNCTDKDMDIIKKLYLKYFPESEISFCKSLESESMKSFVNCFYSVKIQFFNELFLLCEKMDCDFEIVKNLMIKNGWINTMHTDVPGKDGLLSYGGFCFPKDTNALLEFMKKNNTNHEVLEATISERNKMRKDNINIH